MDPPWEPHVLGLKPAFDAPEFQFSALEPLMHQVEQLFKFLVALGPLVKAVTHDARLLSLEGTVIPLLGWGWP